MNKCKFTIAGLNILIFNTLDINFRENIETFYIPFDDEKADIIYNIKKYSGKFDINGKLLSSDVGYKIIKQNHTLYYLYNVGCSVNEYYIVLEISNNNINNIYIPEVHLELLKKDGIKVFSIMAIEIALIKHYSIYMHASFIKYKNKGILFTGPSGIGKSTQASLWENFEGAEIINGDKVIINVKDEITGYGSFCCGSSNIIKNEKANINAICFLKQSKQNKIRKLSIKEAFIKLYPRFLVLSWSEEYLKIATDIIMDILQKVDIYEFECRKDESAVNYLKENLKL